MTTDEGVGVMLPPSDRSLQPGDRIGGYTVVDLLGAGGMGEVYRAQDRKLGRDVAIKILPRLFTDDRERLARFEREARMLAALNHPYIASIYGVEEDGDLRGLVLELVEGPTLADRLAADTLPMTEVVTIGRQIADALEAAHEKGIIHRDLKPANIKFTLSGDVKVLDFGLAKSDAGGPADSSHAPTVTGSGGALLGTAPYMSPEQARGLAVDKRTDIWSFGCVLFEMATGVRAFQGQTITDVIVGVLTQEPPWHALPDGTPPGVRRLLQRSLHKDPRRRLRDIGDARADLDETPTPAPQGVDQTLRRVACEIEFQRLTDFVGSKESAAISPDGKMVAFVAPVGGHRQIWVRLLAGGTLVQVTRGEVEHEHPRWAPDSNALVYYTPAPCNDEPGTIWEITALGGSPRRVAKAIGGADVSHDGQRIAVVQPAGEQPALMSVARDGSDAQRIALLPPGWTYSSLRWAPDDSAVAFLRASGRGFDMSLEVATRSEGERRHVARSEWLKGFCWLPDGSGFVYSTSRGSTLLYPPVFNLRTISRAGTNDAPLTFGDQSYVDPDLHRSGKLIASRIRSKSDIWRFPIGGDPRQNTREAVRITAQTGHVQTPTVSPDGTEVAYLSDSGGHANVWIANTDGSATRQVTFEHDPRVAVGVPKWSPAGTTIVFLITRNGQSGLWTIEPDGSGLRQVITHGWAPCWSGSGQHLYYRSLVEGVGRLEKIAFADGTITVVREESEATFPAVSSDGAVLYYVVPVRSDILGWRGADVEIRRARGETGPADTIARIPAQRIAYSPLMAHVVLSPDDRSLAIPLVDGATTNLWVISTADGSMQPITDFGDRPILMTRGASWSADSRSLYAAVAEYETDIVLIDGLVG